MWEECWRIHVCEIENSVMQWIQNNSVVLLYFSVPSCTKRKLRSRAKSCMYECIPHHATLYHRAANQTVNHLIVLWNTLYMWNFPKSCDKSPNLHLYSMCIRVIHKNLNWHFSAGHPLHFVHPNVHACECIVVYDIFRLLIWANHGSVFTWCTEGIFVTFPWWLLTFFKWQQFKTCFLEKGKY